MVSFNAGGLDIGGYLQQLFVHTTHHPAVTRVFPTARPFEIRQLVVRLIAVEVVNVSTLSACWVVARWL
jgi:hypothetical protein